MAKMNLVIWYITYLTTFKAFLIHSQFHLKNVFFHYSLDYVEYAVQSNPQC